MAIDYPEMLKYINPAELDYNSWLKVGMALKSAGFPCSVWDEWSRADKRYKPGECERRWRTFHGCENGVTLGTLRYYASRGGWKAPKGEEFSLAFGRERTDEPMDYRGDHRDMQEMRWQNKTAVPEVKLFLKAVFQPEDIVGYVTTDVKLEGETEDFYAEYERLHAPGAPKPFEIPAEEIQKENEEWEKRQSEAKFVPLRGVYTRTAGELLMSLEEHPDDIEQTFGPYRHACGGWIHINPLDGFGVKNENVAAFRHALVECDDIPPHEQEAVIRRLQIPVAALVFSGNKSMHALVKINARSFSEYASRTAFLYDYLEKNGLHPDPACKNPGRMCRLPGLNRGNNLQLLVAVNIGYSSWESWRASLSGDTVQLPDFLPLDGLLDEEPDLPEELLQGMLRRGRKMILSGDPKCGKSFLLLELAAALSNGEKWLGILCRKSRVLYVDLELGEEEARKRYKDVYLALGYPAGNYGNTLIWDLRGRALNMEKFAGELIRRLQTEPFDAVLIDPIYKLGISDENSASDVAAFCSRLDEICAATGAACIYAHHHSKGNQGFKKAMDRSSGSGVFSRDADVIADVIELRQSEKARKSAPAYQDRAFRLECSLRSFGDVPPVNFWFHYPVHIVDETGVLSRSPYLSGQGSIPTEEGEAEKVDRRQQLQDVYDRLSPKGDVTLRDIGAELGILERAARNLVNKYPDDFCIQRGVVHKIQKV